MDQISKGIFYSWFEKYFGGHKDQDIPAESPGGKEKI